MNSTPLRILAFDGGGVRGISSLCILKEIMAQLSRQYTHDHPDNAALSLRPSDVFDLICGTSTGGLIALMLGRLQMVFAVPERTDTSKLFTSKSRDSRAKFDHRILEEEIKNILRAKNLDPEAPLVNASGCKTFVVATSIRAANSPVLMRTYDNLPSFEAFPSTIWQVARATSAAPTFFMPVVINGVQYADGGVGYNNPAELALDEADKIWPGRPIGCFVSIGTGLEQPLQLQRPEEKKGLAQSIITKVSGKLAFKVEVARWCVKLLTSSEKVHHHLLRRAKGFGIGQRYFRFNVRQGMSEIGLADWTKVEDMIVLAQDYMSNEALGDKETVAKLLLHPTLTESSDLRITGLENVGLTVHPDVFARDPDSQKTLQGGSWICKHRDASDTSWLVPYERNQDFTGRETQLRLLFRTLQDSTRFHHRVALYGLGGVGKTQIALEFAYRNFKQFYNHVFWISGTDQGSLLSGFSKIAKLINIGGHLNDPFPTDVTEQVLTWLENTGKWLFIIDNLDNIRLVERLLPVGNVEGHVIITTRNAHSTAIPAQGFEIDVLSSEEAAQMLILRSSCDSLMPKGDELPDAIEIVKELGYLPLAIEQSAAYMRECGLNPSTFRSLYRERKTKLLARRPLGNTPYDSSVATTWSVSIDRLKQTAPGAIQLIRLFAFLDPDEIPLDYLQAGADGLRDELQQIIKTGGQLDECVAALRALSLVRTNSHKRTVSIHRLVQTVIRLDLKPECWHTEVFNMAVAAIHSITNLNQRNRLRDYHKQLIACANDVTEEDWRSVNDLLGTIWSLYFQDGLWAIALGLSQRSLDLCKKHLNLENRDTMEAMIRVAVDYRFNGRFEEAVVCLTELLELAQRHLGHDDLFTLSTKYELGRTYYEQKRINDAISMYTEVLSAILGKPVTPPDESRTEQLELVTIRDLARAYVNIEAIDEATDMLKDNLARFQKLRGIDHIDSVPTMEYLASLYMKRQQHEQSAELANRVVKVLRESEGDDHPRTLAAMRRLAHHLLFNEEWEEAYQLLKRVHKGYHEKLSYNHPETAGVLEVIVDLCSQMGLFWEGKEYLEDILEAQRQASNHDELYVLITRRLLGKLQFSVGLVDEGLSHLKLCFDDEEKILGENHPETLTTLTLIATFYRMRGDHSEAKSYEALLEGRNCLESYERKDTMFCHRTLTDYTYQHLHVKFNGDDIDNVSAEESLTVASNTSPPEKNASTISSRARSLRRMFFPRSSYFASV